MFGKQQKERAFFDCLCQDYYEKVLRYLYAVLGDENAARDCTQDVFLTACQKCTLLAQHPNPGGFLFQTAKNLAKKARRESFQKLMRDASLDDTPLVDVSGAVETQLDRSIDESQYIDAVLSQLSPDKQTLYSLYYVGRHSMSDIASQLDIAEPALRMRYVRLRREIRSLVQSVAEEKFQM